MCSSKIAFVAILASFFTLVFSNSNLEFIQEPISRLVKISDGRAVFRCEASPPGTEIQWLFKGGPLPHNRWIRPSDTKLTIQFGKLDNALRLSHFFEVFNEAYFQCEIRFKGKALISPPAYLYIAVLDDFPPQPTLNLAAIAGNTAVIPCDPPHSVPTVVTEFSFNNKIIDKSTGNKYIMPSGDLQIFNVKHEDTGEYWCIANNPYLEKKVQSRRKVILHVIEPTEVKPVSFIKTPPSKVSVALGRNLTFECAAVGHPKPTIKWRRNGRELSDDRYQQQGGNLKIINVKHIDEGTYTCEAADSMGNRVTKSSNLEILVTPQITRSPTDVTVELGDNFTLDCQNRGHPKPSLKWIHNGREILESKSRKGSQLVIQNVHQRHAGIYLCMATNSLGTAIASSLVTVTSGNVSLGFEDNHDDGDTGSPYHSDRERGFDDQNSDDSKRSKDTGKRHNKRKHSKGVKLIPPSKPEINRLSNTSVMVRWTAGEGGLPINFFKLQYKEVGRRKSNWMTIDEDIAAHIHSYAVVNLITGGAYRFRIAAVYSNSDNRDGPISDKFVLTKDTPMEKPPFIPIITYAEAVSPSAITLQWEYQEADSIQTDGFFIHYRATHMAGKYLKVSVLGSNTRSHIISHLLPDTGYDIKMQSFNRAGTSDFSNIFTAKTKKSEETPATRNRNSKTYYNDHEEIPSITPSFSSKGSNSDILYIVIPAIVVVVSVIVFCICVVKANHRLHLCCHKDNTSQNYDDDDKNDEEPMKIANGHVTSNGYISVGSKINLNINPLSYVDLDSSEKTDELEDNNIRNNGSNKNNNNEIIRLQTFNINSGAQEEPLLNDVEREQNNINCELDKITSVISTSNVEMNAESPVDV